MLSCKSPIPSPGLLSNSPSPASWLWHSLVLGHIIFTRPRASTTNDGQLGHLLLHKMHHFLPLPYTDTSKYAWAWQIQKWMLYWMEHRSPNRGAGESTQGAEGVCNLIGRTIWTSQYPPDRVSLVAYVAEDGLVGHQWEERPLAL